MVDKGIDSGVKADGSFEMSEGFQTQVRGTHANEYDIYCACSNDKPLKTFEEWLNS